MTTDSAGSNIGAIKWMSPESITTNEYSEKSDAFSFGVISPIPPNPRAC
jgi:serine/threonine protein kinase